MRQQMTLINLTILITLFFHINSLAFDSWSFIVNKSSLECKGHERDRFWICDGPYYRGLIDRKPENPDHHFFPMLMSENGPELNLIFEQWTDAFGEDLLGNKRIKFERQDYFNFELNLSDTFELKSLLLKNDILLPTLFKEFNTKMNQYFSDLKEYSFYQYVFEVDDTILSEFIPYRPREQKDPTDPIICLGVEKLSLESQQKYLNITKCEGRETSYEEAQMIFNAFAARPDLPFKYTNNGCFSRTHVIACELFNQKIRTGKIWIAGDLWNPHVEDQAWSYHVAPLIYTRNEKNELEIYVIDPAIHKNLLTIDEWLERYECTEAKRISFPIPATCELYEDVIVAFSSHEPMYPHEVSTYLPLSVSLQVAHEINQKHQNKLLKMQ